MTIKKSSTAELKGITVFDELAELKKENDLLKQTFREIKTHETACNALKFALNEINSKKLTLPEKQLKIAVGALDIIELACCTAGAADYGKFLNLILKAKTKIKELEDDN